MDATGRIRAERALDTHGKVLEEGLEYTRSSLLSSVPVHVPSNSRVTWVTEVEVHSGYLTFNQSSEDQVIKTCRAYGARFRAHTLEKVNNDADGDSFTFQENFYPVLYKMLEDKQDWKPSLHFKGLATFELGTIEWTDSMMNKYGDVLKNAEIFGAVGVSRFPYHFCPNSWKAFCELWGPLTNTLHHGNGEMGISLHDLKLIGGLPILGYPYEEFVPVNSELCSNGPYPPTVTELLRIHSQLCSFHKRAFIYWDQWANYFYRGQLLYAAYGETGNRMNYPQQRKHGKRQTALMISKKGELAAFLAYWLSRFVLPSRNSNLRPDTFYMACLMAEGVKVSLAPTVLGYIYHGLGLAVTDPKGPGDSRACFPIHYVVGWLGEYFPCLYKCRADSELPPSYPHLARYAGVEAVELDISSARRVFRTNVSVIYRPSPFIEQNGCFLADDSNLSSEQFEMLVCMRSSLLPVRVGHDLLLEPYYPNRFARQFGFDQGVPSNKLNFGLVKRERCCIEDLANAQHVLLQTDTGTRFYIPRSTYNGACTWTYCRWWMRACAPYLGRSVSNVYLTLTKRPLERRDDIFVIRSIREVSSNLRKEILFSEEGRETPAASIRRPLSTIRTNKKNNQSNRTRPSSNNDEFRNLKRHRREGCHDIGAVATGQDSAFGELNQDTSLRTHTKTYSRGDANRNYRRACNEGHKGSGNVMVDCDLDKGVLSHNSVVPRDSRLKYSQQEESKLQALKLPLDETEAKFHYEGNSQCGNNSESASGGTELIDSDTCMDDDVYEDISTLNETRSSLYNIFDSDTNGRRRDLIIVEMQDILDKITSSLLPKKILDYRAEISATIIMLRSMVDTLGSGKAEFEWFAKTVNQAFELAVQLSQGIDPIERDINIDAAHINDLISRHEECRAAKNALNSQLLDFGKQLADLKATEQNIIEAEEQARQLRKNYKSAEKHLEGKVKDLTESSKLQEKLDEELRLARIEAQEDKLAEYERIKSSYKAQEEKLERLISSLKFFGQKPQ